MSSANSSKLGRGSDAAEEGFPTVSWIAVQTHFSSTLGQPCVMLQHLMHVSMLLVVIGGMSCLLSPSFNGRLAVFFLSRCSQV